ncbi:hypothetical protein [Nonomuraea turkmeniaca]|uniref:hypothetical protein n=1 Tax=Nonomuraea turkmeniaca TaxID=103838 RepID=UPI00147747AE|nr:hypothetical protein [Nonomuraea turkmeniaca]
MERAISAQAVEAHGAGGERTEWPAPWREILRDLRDSPHLEVRQDAWDTTVD